MQTIAALARELEEGRTTARALVEQSLERIADPAGEGASTFLAVHTEAARAAADYVDGLRKLGRQPSRFAGIPMSLKDLFDEAGEVTKAGSVVLADAPPASVDAPAVRRLKALGFISVGRTNMTEFAYSGVGLNSHYGQPRAVWGRGTGDRATGRIPGGSSAGAAVSVADGMAALGLGTDTGGSCRIPAGFNGIVGYKSSTGRVPTAGVFPLSQSFDSVGPLARSVGCCAAADAIMAEDWDGVVGTREPATLRFGVLRSVVLDDLQPEVAAGFEAALARLGKAGVGFVDVALPELAELPQINAGGGIVAAEAFAIHRDRIASDGKRFDQRVVKRIAAGGRLSADQLIATRRRRAELIAAAERIYAGLDGLVMPTTPNLPAPIAALDDLDEYVRINLRCLRNTFIGNFLDACAITLPVQPAGEPPVGLMIMAPHGQDRQLFAAAGSVEAVLGGGRG
jgi:aspartyl-tRNA(Asn)/glutamyl-tRNA(Gln) amidotransferase subunit A